MSSRRSKDLSSKQSALDKLKRARRGEKNIREYDDSTTAFYAEIEDDEYQKRIDEQNEFVEDDDGSGYVDYGQVETNYYSDEERETKVKKLGTTKKTPAPPKPVKQVKPEETLPQLFKKTAASSYGANFSRRPVVSSVKVEDAGDDMLNSILNQMDTRKPVATSRFSSASTSNRTQGNITSHSLTDTKQKLGEFGSKNLFNSMNHQSESSVPSIKQENATLTFLNSSVPDVKLDTTDFQLGSDVEDTNDLSQHLEETHLDVSPNVDNHIKQDHSNNDDKMDIDEPEKKTPQWMKIQKSTMNAVKEEDQLEDHDIWDEQLPKNEDELIMYWIDAVEHDGVVYIFGKTYNQDTKQFTSCAVRVDGLHRCLYFLPKGGKFLEENDDDEDSSPEDDQDAKSTKSSDNEGTVTYEDLRSEVMNLFTKYNITGRKGFKRATKKYAFEDKSVPCEAEYLFAIYPFDMPTLPQDLQGSGFSKVFGTNTSALELLLIQQKLMGPGWIKITNCEPSDRQVTYCAQEYNSYGYKSVKPLTDDELEPLRDRLPPLRVIGLTVKTVVNPDTKENEISMIHLNHYNQVDITKEIEPEKLSNERLSLIRQLPGTIVADTVTNKLRGEGIEARICHTEGMLLNALMAWLTQKDPDVFVGHSLIGFGLDVLLTRLKALNIKMWSKIGRLRRTHWPKGFSSEGGFTNRGITSGRLLCDTYLGAKETVKSKNYTLATLSESQLGITKETIEYERIREYYDTTDSLVHLVRQGDFDSFLTVKLMFKLQLLPLSLQLTNLAGNLWTRTLTGGKSERNEYLLLHEFYNRGYIVPDKVWNLKKTIKAENETETVEVSTRGRRKPAYSGGLVLEPKKGLYDKIVLLLDFNSLYPSIIQEYNVCFTTVERPDEDETLPEVPSPDLDQGILPQLLSFLVERRRHVKNMMKDSKLDKTKYAQLNIRQTALKLTANSMYGCLGFTHSRFYAKPLAMLITSRGREILQNTMQTAQEEGLDVIYGDTDSIMIYTGMDNSAEALKIGQMFKTKINQKYKLLELDTDGIYSRMLLLKKKKYAALISGPGNAKPTLETKGLDMVRRDWCELSRNMSKYVLDLLLNGDDRDVSLAQIHAYLTEKGMEISSGRIPIEQFVVDKGLTRSPENYNDASIHPHVQVALQLKKKGIVVKAGDTVPYVICDTPNGGSENTSKSGSGYASRAFHPEEVANNPALKIDYGWYLANQIHPPLARLFEPIEGTDEARIAECLGLDPGKYRGAAAAPQTSMISSTLESLISESERFRNMPKLTVTCPHNHGDFAIDHLLTQDAGVPLLGVQCPADSCDWMPRPETISYKLQYILRDELRKLNTMWTRCDDPSCGYRTRAISVRNAHQGLGRGCPRVHCDGRLYLESSPARFYSVLAYFERLFDENHQSTSLKDRMSNIDTLTEKVAIAKLYRVPVHDMLKGYGDRNHRRYVDLREIFKYCQA